MNRALPLLAVLLLTYFIACRAESTGEVVPAAESSGEATTEVAPPSAETAEPSTTAEPAEAADAVPVTPSAETVVDVSRPEIADSPETSSVTPMKEKVVEEAEESPSVPAPAPAKAESDSEPIKAAPESVPASPPTATNDAALIAEGGSIFKAKCTTCHGADAKGDTAMGKKLGLPDLASPEVQAQDDPTLTRILLEGKSEASAKAHRGRKLSADQVRAVIAYLRTLG